jgi:hypothetical protein
VKQPEETAPPSRNVPGVVEHLFRHEAGKMVATLTRIFGLEHLTLAEEISLRELAQSDTRRQGIAGHFWLWINRISAHGKRRERL